MNAQTDFFAPIVEKAKVLTRARVDFDGGAKGPGFPPGLGNGYGSYRINDEAVARVDHRAVMTANCAEVLTLCCALEELAARQDPAALAVHVQGDSQIALSRLKAARGVGRGKKNRVRVAKGSEGYVAACERLRAVAVLFGQFTSRWQPRERSVETFGH